MRLTEEQALKYARYRLRFLEGPAGAYEGPQIGTYDPVTDQYFVDINIPGLPLKRVPAQRRDARVSFIRNTTRPVDEPGAFVVLEKMDVDPATATEPGKLDTGNFTSIKHGDNTLKAAWAIATFVAEYVITFDLTSLRLANSILQSLQRLGNYSPGYDEPADRGSRPAGEMWGYILRGDVVDDNEGDAGDDGERIQKWLDDPDAENSLEPSPDQYTGLFCAAVVALRVLSDAQVGDPDFPTTADHTLLIDEVRERIQERVRACHRYVAQHCRYLLKHPTGRMVKRGGWCWQFSLEFAQAAAAVLNDDVSDHFEPFALELLPDIFSAFVPGTSGNFADLNADHIADLALNGIEDVILSAVVAPVRDVFFGGLTVTVPIIDEEVDLLSFLDDFASLKTDVDGAIRNALRGWIDAVIKPVLKPLLQATIQAAIDAGELLDPVASLVLARFLFKVFSDLFFSNNLPTLEIGGIHVTTVPASLFVQMLLFDPASLSTSIDIDIDLEIVTNGFTVKILGIPKDIGEITWGRFHLTVADLPSLDWSNMLSQFQIPIGFNAKEVIYRTADYNGFDQAWIAQKLGEAADLNPFKGDFFPFGYYNLMAVNGSFADYAFDGGILATAFQNGFFAALNYRLHGSTDALSILQDQLAVAPETFPNGRSGTVWDEDFLWLRNRTPGNAQTDKVFSGLDFLSATIIAASADAPGNRRAIRESIEKVIEESSTIEVPDRDGVFVLPFRGPIVGGMPVYVPSPSAISRVTHLGVAVYFRGPGSPGLVRVRVANEGISTDIIEFRQTQPGKMVIVPVSPSGISIESADPGLMAALVIALP